MEGHIDDRPLDRALSASTRRTAFVFDAHPLRGSGLALLVERWARREGLDMVREPTWQRAQEVLKHCPDCRVAVLGVERVCNGTPDTAAMIEVLRRWWPKAPVLVVAETDDTDDVLAAFGSGARGYLPTTTDLPLLEKALALVLAGGFYMPRSVLRDVVKTRPEVWQMPERAARGVALTARQREVLACLHQGHSNKAIARLLGMQEATVKVHVRQIMRKLGVENRTQAALVGSSLLVDERASADPPLLA